MSCSPSTRLFKATRLSFSSSRTGAIEAAGMEPSSVPEAAPIYSFDGRWRESGILNRPFGFIGRAREFGGAPIVERAISGRARGIAWPIICRKAPAAGRPARPIAPFFSPERKHVARVPGLPLPKFPAKDGEAD